MKRELYLKNLGSELGKNNVADIEEILNEYREHFKLKLEDGYSEEEIAARLGEPKELAAQYGEFAQASKGRGIGATIAILSGIIWLDITVYAVILSLFAVVFSLALTAFSLGLAGICMAAGINSTVVSFISIPVMPYFSSLLLGMTCIASGVLAAVGTYYSWLYSLQITKAFNRWNMFAITGRRTHPPVPLNPGIEPKRRRQLRTVTLVSLAVMAVTLIGGYISLIIMSGSPEPWHVYSWFV